MLHRVVFAHNLSVWDYSGLSIMTEAFMLLQFFPIVLLCSKKAYSGLSTIFNRANMMRCSSELSGLAAQIEQ